MTGRKLGNYDILDKLGEGGMGAGVARQGARLNRSVAVKILPADVAGDPVRRERFEQEARALGALNHPNIVAVYDIGQSEGQAYIVSELVDGESLRTISSAAPSPAASCSTSPRKRRKASRPPTRSASSTATSSPRTSCWPATAA